MLGKTVRVLAPFNEAYPGEYLVVAWNEDAQAWTLEGAGDFAAEYIEEI